MILDNIVLLCYVPEKASDNRFDERTTEELYDNLENTTTINQIAESFKSFVKNVQIINICDNNWKSLINNDSFVFNYTYFDVFKDSIKPLLYLEELGCRYVGSTPKGYYTAADKELAKILVASKGFKTPKYFCFSQHEGVPDVQYFLDYFVGSKYLIIKPNNEEASVGLKFVKCTRESLSEIINTIKFDFCDKYIVEEFIEGFDVTIPIIGRENDLSMHPLILERDKQLYDNLFVFTASLKSNKKGLKWKKANEYFSQNVIDEIISLSRFAFKALFQKDFSRIDTRVTENGDVYFLEINPNPQLNPVGGSFVEAAKIENKPFSSFLQIMCNV